MIFSKDYSTIKTEIEKLKVESAKLLLSFQDEIKSLRFNLIFFQQTTNYSSKTENEIQIQAQMEMIANKVKESEENISKINAEIARLQSMLHPTRVVDYSHLDRLNMQMNPTSVQTDFMTNIPVEQVIEEQNVQLDSAIAATSAK